MVVPSLLTLVGPQASPFDAFNVYYTWCLCNNSIIVPEPLLIFHVCVLSRIFWVSLAFLRKVKKGALVWMVLWGEFSGLLEVQNWCIKVRQVVCMSKASFQTGPPGSRGQWVCAASEGDTKGINH